MEVDLLVDAVLGFGLAQVGQDLVGAGDGVLVAPGLELVAEGVQVGVGANPRVTEQIPGAAGGGARLQDGVRPAWLFLLQGVGSTDARDAGADDQHVDVLDMVAVEAVAIIDCSWVSAVGLCCP